jgi:hypothetical protein
MGICEMKNILLGDVVTIEKWMAQNLNDEARNVEDVSLMLKKNLQGCRNFKT